MVNDELLTIGDFYENFLSRGIGAEILHSRITIEFSSFLIFTVVSGQ